MVEVPDPKILLRPTISAVVLPEPHSSLSFKATVVPGKVARYYLLNYLKNQQIN
jgi:hypothetical protein